MAALHDTRSPRTTYASDEILDPTVDELQALKRLELGNVSIEDALHDHVPHRLYDLGYIAKSSDGELRITEKGLSLSRRQP